MRKPSSIVLPFLGFLTGAAAGAWLSAHRPGLATATEKTDPRSASGIPSTDSMELTINRPFATSEEMLAAIMSAVVQEEPLLRAHQLRHLMGRLSSAELSVLFDKAVKVKDLAQREALMSALLSRWSVVDHAAAKSAVDPFFS